MTTPVEDFGPDARRLGELAARLHRFMESECGPGCRVINFGVMEDGHAGLTFGFDLVGSSGHPRGGYVLKLAPVGVRRRGNTDVYRQAPLLRGLKQAGMPVPAVPWASPDEDALGTPFIIMERLPGRVFFVWEPHRSFARNETSVRAKWLLAAHMLARLHQVDWRTELEDWEPPRALRDEVDTWTSLLRHAETPALADKGAELHGLLATHMPAAHPIGVVHGDFQPGNILYADDEATAIIDWELSSIGAQGLDVGWLLMMADHLAWPPACRPIAPLARTDLLEAYRAAAGPALFHIDWYQALAHFRLGSIGCLNVKLHRSGKRPDRFWESFAPAIPVLFARGIELVLGGGSAGRMT